MKTKKKETINLKIFNNITILDLLRQLVCVFFKRKSIMRRTKILQFSLFHFCDRVQNPGLKWKSKEEVYLPLLLPQVHSSFDV